MPGTDESDGREPAGPPRRRTGDLGPLTPVRVVVLFAATVLIYWPLFALIGVRWPLPVALGGAAVSTGLIVWKARRGARDARPPR